MSKGKDKINVYRKHKRLHRLRNMRKNMSHRCDPSRSKNRESCYNVSCRLPNLSSLSNVLPGRCDYDFTGKIHSSYCVVGLIMKETIKKYNLVMALFVFTALPLLFWALGDFPRRTVLKESISVLIILAFFMMLGQFFLARSNGIIKAHKMRNILKIHKVIGYVFVSILLVHPILIVVPRYYESGVAPMQAFITILTTFNSTGVVLGIIAWCSILVLGPTSLLRNKLGLKYKNWRTIHGLLSILFIVVATWHAIDLGRHTDLAMSIYMIILAGSGVLLLLKTYLLKMKTVGD